MVALRHHLRPDEHGAARSREAVERGAHVVDVGVEADHLQLGQLLRQFALELLRPRADARELRGAAGGARLPHRLEAPAVVAVEDVVAVQRQRDVAVRTATRRPARATVDGGRDAAAVEQEDRLSVALDHRSQLRQERRRQRVARLPPQVDDVHGRKRRGDAAAELEPLQRLPRLRPRGRRPEHSDRALEGRALRGHRACVVARIRLLLVRRVVLLVDADHTEACDWREHGRARADDDRRLAARNARTLVPALRLAERRMQNGDPFAEARAEPAERLRRQRDLRHEHDRATPSLERGGAGLEIHLRLAAAGCTVEEEVRALSGVEPLDDAIECGPLRRAPLDGSDEPERASRRRAVVVRDPEREAEERRRELLDDALDRSRLDPFRRDDVDLRDDAAATGVAEPDLDDRARPDLVRHLVRELAREGARGDERIDGRVAGQEPQRRVGS